MFNPYIVCSWIFLLSLLYPIHGISTFPLNILGLFGLMGNVKGGYNVVYHYFSHLGPFLWVPWALTVESILLCAGTFFVYTTIMLLFFKNPVDYYIDIAMDDSIKDFMKKFKKFVFSDVPV